MRRVEIIAVGTMLAHNPMYRKPLILTRRMVVAGILLLTIGHTDVLAQRTNPVRVPPNRPAHLNVQYHRAESAWKSGHSLLEAKTRIDRVLNAIPTDAQALKLRSGISMSMGDTEAALTDARQASTLRPNDGEAHLLVCESASRAGDQKTAISALNRSSILLLDRVVFHVRLSKCAVSLNQMDTAEAYARTAVAGNPRDPEAHLQLARVFMMNEFENRAVTVLNRGLQSGILNESVIRQDTLLAKIADDLRVPETP